MSDFPCESSYSPAAKLNSARNKRIAEFDLALLLSPNSRWRLAIISLLISSNSLPTPFSVRDVYRKDWALLDEKVLAKKAFDELVEANWLRMETTTLDVGRPKLPTYIVNPKLKIESKYEENFF